MAVWSKAQGYFASHAASQGSIPGEVKKFAMRFLAFSGHFGPLGMPENAFFGLFYP